MAGTAVWNNTTSLSPSQCAQIVRPEIIRGLPETYMTVCYSLAPTAGKRRSIFEFGAHLLLIKADFSSRPLHILFEVYGTFWKSGCVSRQCTKLKLRKKETWNWNCESRTRRMEGQVESISAMLKFAVLPIAKVFVMCSLGFLMSSKYVNILPRSRCKLLNGLVFTLFLPCLIFTQLGRAVTVQKMLEWWFIPMNIILATISGSLIGFIVALIIKPPKDYFKFTIVQIGIGNIGNLPLVLIGAICRDKKNPFGEPQICNEMGSAYISFGQWVGAVILYTYVFHMLSPPQNSTNLNNECGANGIKANLGSINSESVPLLVDEEGTIDYMPNPVDCCTRTMKIIAKASSFLERLKIKQILQPPIVASILAMIIGIIPFLKQLILADDAPFFFITDSCIILSGAMVPCIMLALGGNLVGGPGSSNLGLRTTVSIIFARLFLVPSAGLGIVTLADKFGFIPPNDKMFRFVLLLQHTMPTSILAGAVANIRGFAEKEASAILFWVHAFAVLSMAVWIIFYVNILF